MILYKFDYTIERVLRNDPNQSFTKRVNDHKWLLSERLGRDVGFVVAAVDYFLNFQRFSHPRPKHAI